MRKILFAFVFSGLAIALSNGCAWMRDPAVVERQIQSASETDSQSPRSNKWMHIGNATGVDPRARDIEKNLGFE